MDNPKPKRKTHTSTAVKARYYAKSFREIRVRVRKEISAQFEEKLKAENKSITAFFREAINNYLNNSEISRQAD